MFGWGPSIDINTHETLVAFVKGVKVMTLRDPADGPSEIPGQYQSPGIPIYVNASTGDDLNSGLGIITAKKSINGALAAAVSGRGDVILVQPGTYAENVLVTKDAVTIIGSVNGGYERPDVQPASGVALEVKAQGFVAIHMRFAATAADGVIQRGNGFNYIDCVFDGDGTANKAGVRLQGLNTNHKLTASEGRIQDCLFRGCAKGLIFDSAAGPDNGVGSTDNYIVKNRFYSNTIDITAEKSGAGGDYSVQLVNILENSFEDKNKAVYIDIITNEDGPAGNQSGTIMGNRVAKTTAVDNTNIKINGTKITYVGNYDAVGITNGGAF